jgi:hypothetical protein
MSSPGLRSLMQAASEFVSPTIQFRTDPRRIVTGTKGTDLGSFRVDDTPGIPNIDLGIRTANPEFREIAANAALIQKASTFA